MDEENSQPKLSNRANVVLAVAAALPLLAVAVMTGVFAFRHYRRGLEFVPGLHVFGYMLDAMLLGLGYLVVGAISMMIVFPFWRRTRQAVRTRLTGSLLLAPLLIPASCVTFEWAFRSGREQAYAGVDAAVLAEACRSIPADLRSGDRPRYITANSPEFARLPDGVRAMRPLSVHLGTMGTAIRLDGGGIAGDEGLYVASDPAAKQRIGLILLSPQFGVYRYNVDSDAVVMSPGR